MMRKICPNVFNHWNVERKREAQENSWEISPERLILDNPCDEPAQSGSENRRVLATAVRHGENLWTPSYESNCACGPWFSGKWWWAVKEKEGKKAPLFSACAAFRSFLEDFTLILGRPMTLIVNIVACFISRLFLLHICLGRSSWPVGTISVICISKRSKAGYSRLMGTLVSAQIDPSITIHIHTKVYAALQVRHTFTQMWPPG